MALFPITSYSFHSILPSFLFHHIFPIQETNFVTISVFFVPFGPICPGVPGIPGGPIMPCPLLLPSRPKFCTKRKDTHRGVRANLPFVERGILCNISPCETHFSPPLLIIIAESLISLQFTILSHFLFT